MEASLAATNARAGELAAELKRCQGVMDAMNKDLTGAGVQALNPLKFI